MTTREKKYGLRLGLAGLLIGVGLYVYGYRLASPSESVSVSVDSIQFRAASHLPSTDPAVARILHHPSLASGPVAVAEEFLTWSLICALNAICGGMIGVAIAGKRQRSIASA